MSIACIDNTSATSLSTIKEYSASCLCRTYSYPNHSD